MKAMREFEALSKDWRRDKNGEIKGRLVGESDFYDFIEMLRSNECFFDCVAMDTGLIDDLSVARHREIQAQKLVAGLTERHQSSLIAEVNGIAEELRSMRTPQYLQLVAQNILVFGILQTKTLYYCQAAPEEIGNFRWRIDAKAETRTRAEQIWRTIAPGLIEAHSFREPSVALVEGDYSHFDRFRSELTEEDMELRRRYHKAQPKPIGEFTENGFDPGKVLRDDMVFGDSRNSTALQMADVITSLAARALRGNIGRRAWWHLGQIMHRQFPPGREIIHMITLGDANARWTTPPPYYDVLRHLRQTSRSLILR